MEPIFNSGDDSCYIVFACVCTIGLGGICGAAIQFGSLWIPKGGVKGYFICGPFLLTLMVSLRHVWNPQLHILVFPILVDPTTIHIVALD